MTGPRFRRVGETARRTNADGEALTVTQRFRESGQLATGWCPEDNVLTEYFVPGTEPLVAS